jgi:hypothetical protein
MNGTLKSIIRKLCFELPRDWDKYLTAALFAYREAPQASTGFSPFELLYGRTVRGPMMIMKELMTKEISETEVKTVYQYVIDLKTRLSETMKIAQDELKKAQARYKVNFDKRAKMRNLKPGDKALIILPTNNNVLLMQWKGPFEVTERINEVDYKLNVHGKEKMYHGNIIKLYIEQKKVFDQREDESALRDQTNTEVECKHDGKKIIFIHKQLIVTIECFVIKGQQSLRRIIKIRQMRKTNCINV